MPQNDWCASASALKKGSAMTTEIIAKALSEYDDPICEHGCSDGYSSFKWEVDGVCPDCGYPTVGGKAASSCYWSPVDCETCGRRPCDGSC